MINIGAPLPFPRRMRPGGALYGQNNPVGGVNPSLPTMPPIGPYGGIRPGGSPDEGFTGGIRPLPSPNEGFPVLGNGGMPGRPIVDPALVKPPELPGPPPPMMGDFSMTPLDPKAQMRLQNQKKFAGIQPLNFMG